MKVTVSRSSKAQSLYRLKKKGKVFSGGTFLEEYELYVLSLQCCNSTTNDPQTGNNPRPQVIPIVDRK